MRKYKDIDGGCSEVAIAVIDGPIDLAHACFHGARVDQTASHAPRPQADCAATAHGTHVASILFGQPGSPACGLVPACRGISLPVFGSNSENKLNCSQLDLARAIVSAVEYGAMVINVSGGQLDFSTEPEDFLRGALDRCEESGVLVVAAAGNDGCDCPHTPASYPTVLAVGAAGPNGAPLSMSNWGDAYRNHGLLAPGFDVPGAAPGGGVASRTGTSFATPIVSGYAALLLCRQIADGQTPDPLAVRRALLEGATRSLSSQQGDERQMNGTADLNGAWNVLKQRRMKMADTQNNAHPSGDEVRAEMVAPSGGDEHEHLPVARPAPSGDAALVSPGAADRAGGDLVAASCGDGPCTCKGDGGCGCGGSKSAAVASQKVYALGSLSYDFGTESRRDSILQYMKKIEPGETPAKDFDQLLIEHLSSPEGGADAERIIWTLNVDNTPVYAIQPAGAFAYAGYETILKLFEQQISKGIPRIAIPGTLGGRVRLMSGESVPMIFIALKGVTPWDAEEVTRRWTVRDDKGKKKTGGRPRPDAGPGGEHLTKFLRDFIALTTRKYRNLGIAGSERALNFASTDVFRAFDAIDNLEGFNLTLDDIEIKRSAVCRAGSECFDVQLKLFKSADITAAINVLQWTIDVTDAVPVSLGGVSTWSERPRG